MDTNCERRLIEKCVDIDSRRDVVEITRFLDRHPTYRCLHYGSGIDHDIVLDS